MLHTISKAHVVCGLLLVVFVLPCKSWSQDLTDSQLIALLQNTTVYGRVEKTNQIWKAYFASNGRVYYLYTSGKGNSGSWTVQNNRVCIQFDKGKGECRTANLHPQGQFYEWRKTDAKRTVTSLLIDFKKGDYEGLAVGSPPSPVPPPTTKHELGEIVLGWAIILVVVCLSVAILRGKDTKITEHNPLKPISLPLGIRAVLAATLAVAILLEFAAELMSKPSPRSLYSLVITLLLLACAIYDAMSAFRTGLRLPVQSLNVHSIIRKTYNDLEIYALIVSGANPNEKFLSWLGHWVARASNRFSRLPFPYQRLFEVALTAAMFAIMAWVTIIGLEAFAHAGNRPEIAAALLSWFSAGLVVLTYMYWVMMFLKFNAADWARVLSVGSVIKVIGGLLLLCVVLSFVSQIVGIRLTAIPALQPWSTIAVVGTIVIVVAIITLTWLRSDGESSQMRCSQIRLSDSAAVHPDSVVSALRDILAQQTKSGGTYSRDSNWNLRLDEQSNMPGGTFSAFVIDEYDITLTQISASRSIRVFAAILGSAGILVGAAAYVVLWQAVYISSFQPWLTCAALMLFGCLALRLANFPLSETVWESYLMGFRVHGSYQNRGSMIMATTGQHPGDGSMLTDYSLDGGIAKAESISFLPATMVKADANRLLVSTSSEDEEREIVLRLLKRHIARAAGSDI